VRFVRGRLALAKRFTFLDAHGVSIYGHAVHVLADEKQSKLGNVYELGEVWQAQGAMMKRLARCVANDSKEQ